MRNRGAAVHAPSASDLDLPSVLRPWSIGSKRISPGIPAWSDVAIGDLAVLLARLDRHEEARQILMEFADDQPDTVHRLGFEHIWRQASTGTASSGQ